VQVTVPQQKRMKYAGQNRTSALIQKLPFNPQIQWNSPVGGKGRILHRCSSAIEAIRNPALFGSYQNVLLFLRTTIFFFVLLFAIPFLAMLLHAVKNDLLATIFAASFARTVCALALAFAVAALRGNIAQRA